MAHEALSDSRLVSALRDLFTDLKDLLQKEVRLARAEIAGKLTAGIEAGVWFAVAALVALVAAFLLIQAIVFFIASFGIAMHWSCLIVAAALAAVAAAAFFYGRSLARGSMRPDRTISQINKDIRAVRSN